MDPKNEGRRRSAASPTPGTGREAAQPSQRRPGSHDPEGNRHAVLDAARRLFGAHGYRGVGVRAIAAEAGVTPGLVMAYFGTKDGLFREAVGSGSGVTNDVLSAAADSTGELPAALARAYLDRWDRLPTDDPWPALIRSAVSHPPSAELLRTILEKQVGEPLTRLLGDSADAEVRAAVIRSVLFGVIMERYLFAHEPAASVPTEELAPALTDVLTTAFGDALDVVPPPAPGGAADGADVSVHPRVGHPATVAATTRPPSEPVHPEHLRPEPAARAADNSPAALFAQLNECAAVHRGLISRTVREYGISLPAYDVLASLRDAGEPYRRTTGEVAAAGTVRAGGLTQHADRLEAAGLIRRERDADDRRIIRLCLTPEGLELAERIFAVRSAQEQELLAGLGAADRRRLSGLLGTLAQTLGAGVPEQ
ncbi:TetR family transcriptional regulator [Streptomyces sp. JH14]|uniref:TetR/AcrR family transcriptional regulator n=1 Tax=Streptomyces sp. JH14 TaxID=2793630 RepID=UPI0023F67C41|nr:TetR family transcriptional regulator [Streptomyces sp. JH14]MDF6045436.1 TetR family transcriptional regulator [Streptomyces sp. JH14]